MITIENINPLQKTEKNELQLGQLMLQIQILLTKDFDEQAQEIAERIKFLGRIKKAYRENINTIQRFLAKNTITSRKDGKNYIASSFSEMRELMGALITYDPLQKEGRDLKSQGLLFNDNGDKQSAVQTKNDKSSTTDWANYFKTGASIVDPKEAKGYADKTSNDDGYLPFYFADKKNTFENGFPKFSVFTNAIEKNLDQIKNELSNIEDQSEQLANSLNQLVTQRKTAFDGARELLRKMEAVKDHTIKKME